MNQMYKPTVPIKLWSSCRVFHFRFNTAAQQQKSDRERKKEEKQEPAFANSGTSVPACFSCAFPSGSGGKHSKRPHLVFLKSFVRKAAHLCVLGRINKTVDKPIQFHQNVQYQRDDKPHPGFYKPSSRLPEMYKNGRGCEMGVFYAELL